MNPLLEKLKKASISKKTQPLDSKKETQLKKEIQKSDIQNKLQEKLQKIIKEKESSLSSIPPKKENNSSEKIPSLKKQNTSFNIPPKKETQENPKQKSIISLIQQMIKDGLSEQEILSSLKEMGVDEQQAKRLISLGYTDTFNLIKKEMEGEIQKILTTEKQKITQDVYTQIKGMETLAQQNMDKELEKKKSLLSSDLEKKFSSLEQKMHSSFSAFLNDLKTTKKDLTDIKTQQRQTSRDLQELEAVGIGKRNKILAYFLVFMGVLFSIISSYLGFSFLSTFAMEILIIVVATALLGITFLFIATIV